MGAQQDDLVGLVGSGDLGQRVVGHEVLVVEPGFDVELELDIDFVHGQFHTVVYRSEPGEIEHVAFTQGEVSSGEPVLVRMQTASAAHGFLSDLGQPSVLEAPMRRIQEEGKGAIVLIGTSTFREVLESVWPEAGDILWPA